MNIQQLRHSLKIKWLLYYRQNRPWLIKLRIWGTFEGKRRPSSSFILAIVSNLEPQLIQIFPFIVALSNNPDQIVSALGLNFNPEEELKSLTQASPIAETNGKGNGLPIAIQTNGNVALATAVAQTNGNGNGLSRQTLPRDNSEENLSSATGANGNGNVALATAVAQTNGNGNGLSRQTLPRDNSEENLSSATGANNLPSWLDESCNGIGRNDAQ